MEIIKPIDHILGIKLLFKINLKKRWKLSGPNSGELGEGSFGKVIMGLNIDTGEIMAVKQISLAGLSQTTYLEVYY